jgi:hypothetical protein
MQTTGVTQPTTVTPATINIKDDSIILLTTTGTHATAGMKATTGPPTQYGSHQKQGCFQKQ